MSPNVNGHSDNSNSDDISRLNKLIYKLKVGHVISTCFMTAIVLYGLYYLGSLAGAEAYYVFFHKSFFHAFADACLIAAIVGITFEIVVRKETEVSAKHLINDVIKAQAANIIDKIPNSLLLDCDVQRAILKNSKLDEIIVNALELQSLDRDLSEGIYNSIIKKALSASERWYNYRYEIFVEDIVSSSVAQEVKNNYFDVIMRLTYETTLQKTRFLFTCVSTIDQFNKILDNPEYEVRHLMPSSILFPLPNADCFQVTQFTVDDMNLSISPYQKPDGSYEITCENHALVGKLGQKVVVSYTYKIKAERIGHAIFTSVVYPTHNVVIEFNYPKSSIDYVEVLDYFVSSTKPAIKYIPDSDNPHKISVEIKDWVFPKGGAAFVWILKEELNLVANRGQRRKPSKQLNAS